MVGGLLLPEALAQAGELLLQLNLRHFLRDAGCLMLHPSHPRLPPTWLGCVPFLHPLTGKLQKDQPRHYRIASGSCLETAAGCLSLVAVLSLVRRLHVGLHANMRFIPSCTDEPACAPLSSGLFD